MAHNLMAQLKAHGHPDAPPRMATDGKGDYRTVVDGDPAEICAQLGGHTAYVERTNLTARQMNGRLVRKTRSYSKQVEALEAACAWEDWVYNLTRTVDTRSIPDRDEQGCRRWQRQTPAMEAGLTGHRWTIKELLTTVVAPEPLNT